MARPRKRGAKDLPLGLYRDESTGVYYLKWKGKQVSLRTKDRRAALALYNQIFPSLKQQYIEAQAKRIAAQLKQVALVPGSQTFAAYAENWRESVLPKATKKNGKPLGRKTRADYDRMVRNQVTPSEHFKVTVQEVTATVLRRFLSKWLDSPNFYNYIVAVLSRILEAAVDEGLLERNPAADVSKRPTGDRDVYLEDGDYLAITEQIEEEWVVRVCDLMYLLSHHPSDVLSLRESDVHGDEIHFVNTKTDQPMVIEMNEDLRETVDWFRRWKRQQDLHSPHLICHPRSTRYRRMIAQPVTVEYISRRFTAAVTAAGFPPGTYTLRDLRPKGLTDEYVIAGDSDKGGHKTEAMKRHYRRIKLPMRARSNLHRISE